MAVATADADIDVNTIAGTATPSLAFPTSVAVGDYLVVHIVDISDKTTTIVSVVGSLHLTGWNLLQGPTDHSSTNLRSWVYGRVASSAGSETITVTGSGSINWGLGVGRITGVNTSSPIDVTGTAREGASTTDFDSNTVSAAGAGGVLSLTGCGSTLTITADGAGETNVSNESARSHWVFEPYASGGTKGTEVTGAFNASFITHVIAFNEAGGGGGSLLARMMLLGVG